MCKEFQIIPVQSDGHGSLFPDENGILFHTDAVQAYGHIPINVDEMHVDMLSASGHKFNGPKGVGILYIRKGVKIRSFIHGGAQERNRRAGTSNVPSIVGLGKAAQIAGENMAERVKTCAIFPISAIGSIVPISLFAVIMDINMVSGRIAFLFPVYRGRIVADTVGSAGCMCVKRLCLYVRFT